MFIQPVSPTDYTILKTLSCKQMLQYKIVVRTGDRPKAGTNANVYIKLHGDNGQSSRATILDCFWRDDFERGQEDSFNIRNIPVRLNCRRHIYKSNFFAKITFWLRLIRLLAFLNIYICLYTFHS